MNKRIKITKRDALIVVDVQKDFLSGGSLAVPKGEEILPFLNYYLKLFTKSEGKVFATRDWHPINHVSFKKQGGIWPSHCISGTKGAEFHPKLRLPNNTIIISKATNANKESYSGFDATELYEILKKGKIFNVFIAGLATEYCVKNTVLDSLRLGFHTFFLEDASQGIELRSRDIVNSIKIMQTKGARVVKKLNFI